VIIVTADEWEKVENTLSSPYGIAKLKIDGYNVTIGHAQVKPLQYCLAVYIDNIFKTEWAITDCDIRRRFCQRHTKCLLTTKEKKQLNREKKAVREEIMQKMTYNWYEPYWNTFRTMKSHFLKNNTSIELMEVI
jgi:hypothetical protein